MSTVRNDLTIYENHGSQWWNTSSQYFRSLHGITFYRLKTLDKWLGDIRNKTIVDIGCGGGLLSVPLLNKGAQVIGMDLSPSSVSAALSVINPSVSNRAEFFVADANRVPLSSNCADIVLLADVLDHIKDFSLAIGEASRVLKPGGLLYVNTINRTFRSWFLAILCGESLGLIPRGTHDHRLFIRPSELVSSASKYALVLCHIQGELPALIKTVSKWAIHFRGSWSKSVAYSALFKKPQ